MRRGGAALAAAAAAAAAAAGALPGADAGAALVRVIDIDGATLIKEVIAAVPDASGGGDVGGAPAVPGGDVMNALAASGQLAWGFTTLGGRPVVTEIEGIRARLPRAAWILSHARAATGDVAVNVGMADVFVTDGDELTWRLMPLQDSPAPTVVPRGQEGSVRRAMDVHEEEAEGGDDGEEEEDDGEDEL
jgi:hypothetical protein